MATIFHIKTNDKSQICIKPYQLIVVTSLCFLCNMFGVDYKHVSSQGIHDEVSDTPVVIHSSEKWRYDPTSNEARLYNVTIDEQVIRELMNNHKLELLELGGHGLRPETIVTLTKLTPILKKLVIADAPRISDESNIGEFIVKQKNLEALEFENTPISDETLKYISSLPKLKRIHFSDTDHITCDGLALLSKSKYLVDNLDVLVLFGGREFDNSDLPLEDDSSYHFDFMAKFGNLRELTLVCDSFDGMDIQRFRFVKSLKKIEKLILPSRIDDEFIKDYVSSLTNLKQLSLQNSKLSGAGLKYLLNLPALEKLDISNSRLNDNDIAVLAKHQALQFVYIGAPNNITKKGVNYLNAEINKRHPSDIPHVDSYGAISVRDDL